MTPSLICLNLLLSLTEVLWSFRSDNGGVNSSLGFPYNSSATYATVLPTTITEPTLFTVANNSPELRQAMKEEYDALVKNGMWSLVHRASNTNVVDCKLVYMLKRDKNCAITRYKARFVAKGFRQQLDDIIVTVKQILRYLYGTVEHGLLIRYSSGSTFQAFTNVLLKGNPDTSLEYFLDAKLAGDSDDRWSIEGLLYILVQTLYLGPLDNDAQCMYGLVMYALDQVYRAVERHVKEIVEWQWF
ncbi:uncharacterized mitochondrial protein-like protein isoform X2 [Tanacetum coccineum]